MLSVVLYGRNDSHGYNLHKRAAISLNAIAELLTDPDDEILFVDYNTPDDLPTFPEAIADTLTDKAVARLRVLRVRPEVHRERFAARTHLMALEPIARNIAIRRSNPANKWVLSTNTDMIFCPRDATETLTTVVSGLADGFYHLPRFELPEGLWETLDRKDGPGIIATAKMWGERFHLNEITHADHDNLFDGPGDFQLFLRQDLFDIDGFHEEMILGWHLDANIARRMRMQRGQVSSALDQLLGYHCDHTRQASPYHKADRQENDSARFINGVDRPDIPEQRHAWGLPDVRIEELRLGQASAARYLKGLEASLPDGFEGFLETRYILEEYGRLEYSSNHVAPYLLDLLSCVPGDIRIGYVGGRRDTFDLFRRGWRAMDGAVVLLPREADWLEADAEVARSLPMANWVEQAELFIFEVGAEHAASHADLTAEESTRLWRVDTAFKRVSDLELIRQAAGQPPRLIVVINGVHNFFEHQVMTEVAVTLTPYSSHVRQGYMVDRAAARTAAAGPARRAVMRSLGGLEPVSNTETRRLQCLLDGLGGAAADDPVWRQAGRAGAEIEALAVADLISAGPQTTAIIERVRQQRLSQQVKAGQARIDALAGWGSPNRLARLEDWDDPAWAHVARRLFSNVDHASRLDRQSWMWERVSLAQTLMRAMPPGDGAMVLILGTSPDLLAFSLAQQGYAVDIADPAALIRGELKAVDWRHSFLGQGWVAPTPVGLIDDRAEAIAQGFRYDGVLILQNGVFTAGRAAVADALREASGLLRLGGHLGLTALGQPLDGDQRLQEHALPLSFTRDGVFGRVVQGLSDLDLDGPSDDRLTPRSLDRTMSKTDTVGSGPAALMLGEAPQIEAPTVWGFTKADRAADWPALKAILQSAEVASFGGAPSQYASAAVSAHFSPDDLAQAPPSQGIARFGANFEALTPLAGLTRTPMALHIPRAFGAELAAHAALGRISAGAYEIELEAGIERLGEPGPVLAVAAFAGEQLIAETLLDAARPGSERLLLPLQIGEEGWQGVSVLIKGTGRSDITLLSFTLR